MGKVREVGNGGDGGGGEGGVALHGLAVEPLTSSVNHLAEGD